MVCLHLRLRLPLVAFDALLVLGWFAVLFPKLAEPPKEEALVAAPVLAGPPDKEAREKLFRLSLVKCPIAEDFDYAKVAAATGNTRPRRIARTSRACVSDGSASGNAIMSPGGMRALPGLRN